MIQNEIETPAHLNWVLGIENFIDETEKQFNGSAVGKFPSSEFVIEHIKEIVKIFKEALAADPALFPKRRPYIDSGKYWFHLFKREDMANRPDDMFEAAKASLDTKEKSLDEMLNDSASSNIIDSMTVNDEFYFNTDGDLINGIPDKWMVDLGLN